jgi:hypothetical protein
MNFVGHQYQKERQIKEMVTLQEVESNGDQAE